MEELNRLFSILLIFIGICLTACNGGNDCEQNCLNDGVLTIDCTCHCPEGFTGEACETPTCALTCENGGEVNDDCECECLDGYTGIQCDSCAPLVNIINEGNIWDSRDNQHWKDNMEVILPEDYLLCGFGFYKASRLVAYGRKANKDGTLGELTEFRDGANPTGPVAVEYIVPDGHVITGFGYGESQDIYRLVVNYNSYSADENCDVELGPELLYDNEADRAVEVWLKVSETAYDTEKHALGSVGIKYTGTTSRQVEAQVRKILNY